MRVWDVVDRQEQCRAMSSHWTGVDLGALAEEAQGNERSQCSMALLE